MEQTTARETKASDAFHEHELVTIQGRKYPVVGGRLRLAHAAGLSGITTDIVSYDGKKAVIKATVFMGPMGGQYPFNGYGEADEVRDKRLKDAVLELAETRAIARALRFAGFGVEYTGAEEMPRDAPQEEAPAPPPKGPTPGPARPTNTTTKPPGSAPSSQETPSSPQKPSTRPAPSTSHATGGTGKMCEHELPGGPCNKPIDDRVAEYSKKFYGKQLCLPHQQVNRKIM